MGEGRHVYWVLVGRPEGKRSQGSLRHRWEVNIKRDLREIVVFVSMVMNLQVP